MLSKEKQKILIVDDSEMNRSILADMLEGYDIIEAEDGVKAVAMLRKHAAELSLVLLDIVMPRMDGFEVLEIMNQNRWIDDIGVIMVSAENSADQVERAYELGAADFIMRPFDALIVRRRVVNTILLYSKQKQLIGLLEEQIYEKEQRSQLMIDILSHAVEFRNNESGLHIYHVRALTDLLLNCLVKKTDRYGLTAADITVISTASALHDIGKIAINEQILNKPGRLTPEEYEIMKTHAAVGADMLKSLPHYQDEPLVKTAWALCRWHHERYDGRGYPDGLKGDEIPISAQAVALADVYDALTSPRVYKPAFPHEKAVRMILNGECGAFNPLLLECMVENTEKLREVIERDCTDAETERSALWNVSRESVKLSGSGASERTLRLLDYERMKYSFFAAMSEEIQFEYTVSPPMLTLSAWGAKRLGLDEIIMDPLNDARVRAILRIGDEGGEYPALRGTPEAPEMTCERILELNGEPRRHRIITRAIWSQDEPPRYEGTLGKAIDIQDSIKDTLTDSAKAVREGDAL